MKKKRCLEDMIDITSIGQRKPSNYTYFSCDKLDSEHKVVIIPFSDLHLGNKYCKRDDLTKNLNWAYENPNCYLILNGDIIEAKTKSKKGDGVFTQMDPEEQIDLALRLFKPFADQGRIIANINGNHEDAIKSDTGINVSSIMSKFWNVPYLHNGGFIDIKVGSQLYHFYATHGSSGATLPHTKSRSVRDLSTFIEGVDAYLYGHVHAMEDSTQDVFYPSEKSVKTKSIHYILTGHYLNYFNSYAQAKSMRPSATGTPKIKLHGDEKMIRVSLG